MLEPPKVDERTAGDISRALQRLLPRYVDGWSENVSVRGATDALIGIFARFSELIIDRLNRVPEKNLLAFLDLFGGSPSPPQPARAPITFSLSGQAAVDVFVPALTQIAAPPAQGERESEIFETESALTVTSAKLESLFSKDGVTDRYADYSSILRHPALQGIAPFSGNLPVDHALYIGLDTFSRAPALKRVTLRFVLEGSQQGSPEPRYLVWDLWDGRGIPLTPVVDATQTPTAIGGEVTFANLPGFPRVAVHGQTTGWLRCRCVTPITKGSSSKPGMVSEAELPTVRGLTIQTEASREGLPPERAFANSLPLDLTKDFFPLGEKPKRGDTLYLSCPEAFSIPSVRVILHVKLTPAVEGAEPSTLTIHPRAPKLRWEYWNGQEWKTLGDSELTGRVRIIAEGSEAQAAKFSDTTQAFTTDGDISFSLIDAIPQSTVSGQTGCWIRARIISGNYGEDARLERDAARGYVFVPPAFSPPSISSLKVDYAFESTSVPTSLVKYNDFSYVKVTPGEPFRLFEPVKEDGPSLYLGFMPPPGQTLSGRPVSLYFGNAQRGISADCGFSALRSLTWEYWNGRGWARFTVRDDTGDFARSGLVRFVVPLDVAPNEEFGRLRYWLRITKEGQSPGQALLHCILPNTTMATRTLTIFNEILGSSAGKPNQRFVTARHPVLAGQQLQVCESAMPAVAEQALIEREEGKDAICGVLEPDGRREEVWIQWHEVPGFYASSPRDRHYVLDRATGEIRFGDGVSGLIPPPLPKNIRLRRYQTGGGAAGNKPAFSITQLRTSLPYIEGVVNFEAAGGGADAEPVAELTGRAAREIRHGGRAVTAEDYEDLARLASRRVARAKCVPLYDLARDPDAKHQQPGVVSLIIVPSSLDTKPLPGAELMERIRSFLEDRRPLTVDLVLVGPEYVRIDVEAEVKVIRPEEAKEVELAATEAFTSFLNPLTGGPERTGWGFGRLPKESDVYGLVHKITGVDHVRTLTLRRAGERPATEKTGRFLICAGECKVSLVL